MMGPEGRVVVLGDTSDHSMLVLSSDRDKGNRTPFSGDRSSGKWQGLDINGTVASGSVSSPRRSED